MNWLEKLEVRYRADPKVAVLYGVILYTDAHPHIKKVLLDEDYWRSLDAISGRRLGVFAIRAAAARRESHDEFSFTVAHWGEPRENEKLLEDLGLESTRDLPAIVWLTQYEGEILRCVVDLSDRSKTAAFDSLRKAVETASQAVNQVDPSNIRNPLGVFGAVQFAVDNAMDIRRLKKALTFYMFLKELAA